MAKMKANHNIAAAQIQGPELVASKADMPREQSPEPRDVAQFLGLAAKVAENTIYCRNYKIPNAEKHFPHEPLLRTIDKYFPYAKGGPLYIDSAPTKRDVKDCERKAAAMAAEKKRYIYLTDDMDLQEALEQLQRASA